MADTEVQSKSHFIKSMIAVSAVGEEASSVMSPTCDTNDIAQLSIAAINSVILHSKVSSTIFTIPYVAALQCIAFN